MTRKFKLTAFAAAQCLISGFAVTAPARAAEIPQYFFGQRTITSNCTEANAGPAARVPTGLQFKISATPGADGSYTLQTVDAAGKQWPSDWNGVKLQYRAGTKMTTIPADFECAAGSEASSASSSPLLAMSGYVQTVEPQYAIEHFYGLATIHGQPEHVLIFPRDAKGGTSAIIVLESASAGSTINLDDNGVINSD
jgi:hypothetical protein